MEQAMISQTTPAVRMQNLASANLPHLKMRGLMPETGMIANLFFSELQRPACGTVSDLIKRTAAAAADDRQKDLISGLLTAGKKFTSYEELKDHAGYQGLIWAFRSMEKKDFHCHISAGLDESEIAEIVVNSSKEQRKKMAASLTGNEPDFISTYPGIDAGFISSGAMSYAIMQRQPRDIAFLLSLYRPFHLWRAKDFFVTDKESLQQTVFRAALNLLADGATAFDLRMNPYKPGLLDASERAACGNIAGITEQITEAAVKGLDQAINTARSDLGIFAAPSDIRLLFSMNRGKFYGSTHISAITEEIFRSIDRLKQRFPERIAGLDISGAEFSLEEHDPNAIWAKSVSLANNAGLMTTTHIGDLSSMSGILADHYRQAQNGDAAMFETLAEEYLDFIGAFIRMGSGLDCIGHAFMLAPAFLSQCWREFNNDGHDLPDLGSFDRIKSKVYELTEYIKGLKMVIEHCPSVTVSSEVPNDPFKDNLIAGYKRSPIFNWTKANMNVKLGTDGIWYAGTKPRTLSEELARLVLSEPDEITVGKMLSLVRK